MTPLSFVPKLFAVMLSLLAAYGLPRTGWAKAPGHGQDPVGVELDPLFSLLTHRGQRLTRADLRGKPFLVAFGYLNCPDICPATLLELSQYLQQLGPEGDQIRVLFLTVDPERDTVDDLKSYLASFDSRIIGLTGSAAAIAAVTAAFDAPVRRGETREGGYSVDHPARILLVDKYGMLAGAVGFDEPEALRALSQRLLRQ
jgi:protein SCO1